MLKQIWSTKKGECLDFVEVAFPFNKLVGSWKVNNA